MEPDPIIKMLREQGHHQTADEMEAYDKARDYFGISAAYVKQRLAQNGLDYCEAHLEDKACEKPGCVGMQHMTIGKITELVMVALHQEITRRNGT